MFVSIITYLPLICPSVHSSDGSVCLYIRCLSLTASVSLTPQKRVQRLNPNVFLRHCHEEYFLNKSHLNINDNVYIYTVSFSFYSNEKVLHISSK